MLQPLIATLIVLLAAFWVIRKAFAVWQTANSGSPTTPSCGACGGCAKNKKVHVVSLAGPIQTTSKTSHPI